MLINNDSALRAFLPNILTTCEGEASLYEKLATYLATSERWLATAIVGAAYMEAITEDDNRHAICCRIVVLDAFRNAIPSLDLILTPNGFGIVSNSNVAPASSDRVSRLINTLLSNRDQLIELLLPLLAEDDVWRQSERGCYFGRTLWPELSLAAKCGFNSDTWRHYEALHSQLILTEDELAEKFISPELYQRFRQHVLAGTVTEAEQPVIDCLRSVEVELLTGKPLNVPLMISLVQRIRSAADIYPEWQTSATAELYRQQSFQNRKKASGYWF